MTYYEVFMEELHTLRDRVEQLRMTGTLGGMLQRQISFDALCAMAHDRAAARIRESRDSGPAVEPARSIFPEHIDLLVRLCKQVTAILASTLDDSQKRFALMELT